VREVRRVAALGTLLNVALCDEKLGRIASAVAKFSEARDRAREQNLPEHLSAAEDKLEQLEPELPYLTIKLTESPGRDTRILIDDKLLPLDQVVDHAVDPGDRVIVVSAPGRVAFKQTIRIQRRERKAVVVPKLAKAVVSSRRTIGKIVTGSGALVVGTGIGLGLLARSRYNAVIAECPDLVCPDADLHSKAESARTLGNVGTVLGVVGLATVAVGAYLWIRSPKESTTGARVSVVPHVGDGSAAIFAIGHF